MEKYQLVSENESSMSIITKVMLAMQKEGACPHEIVQYKQNILMANQQVLVAVSNDILNFINNKMKAEELRQQFESESEECKEESLKVLEEFEALEDEIQEGEVEIGIEEEDEEAILEMYRKEYEEQETSKTEANDPVVDVEKEKKSWFGGLLDSKKD